MGKNARVTSRRDVLKVGAAAIGGLALGACGSTSASGPPKKPPRGVPALAAMQSPAMIEENLRAGDVVWSYGGATPQGALEGFFDRTSTVRGETATIYVNSQRAFRIEAYRMGYYGGAGGRLVATTKLLAGGAQPPAAVDTALGTVSCHWRPSWRFEIDERFVPGCYLFKLVADNGWMQWVPLTVRDATPGAPFLAINSVTTWQAYNPWGGWSLYNGPTGRADVVSFDRPYELGLGQSNFLFNELPLVYQMERLGLDVQYWTDIDLHERGAELTSFKSMFSLGHDEYWSWPMRAAAVAARDVGVNLAFLGSNFVYRQIRLEPTELGADRLMVNYRSTADPIYATDPKLTTVNWGSPPVSMPESEIAGSIYDGFETPSATWDFRVVDAASWFWDGTGVSEHTRLRNMERNEFNRFDPYSSLASRVQLLGHSPVGNGSYSDATYVTVPSGAGVLSTGTSTWIYAMQDGTQLPATVMAPAIPGVTNVVLRATENLYELFGKGPAATTEPSQPNTSRYY